MTNRMHIAKVTVAVGTALGSACSSPRELHPPRDTLAVVSSSPAAVVAMAMTGTPERDTSGYTLKVLIGSTAASPAAALPQLEMVASDGRRFGYDPLSKRSVAEIAGADYDSTRAINDDDASASGGQESSGDIESRVVTSRVRAGDTFTLAVSASDSGTFVLVVRVFARAGAASSEQQLPMVSFKPRQARHYLVRIGNAAVEVEELS